MVFFFFYVPILTCILLSSSNRGHWYTYKPSLWRWCERWVTFHVLTKPQCCLMLLLLLLPETCFTQIVLKSGLFVILVHVTCLAGESASAEVQAVNLKVESAHRICDPAYRTYLSSLYYTGRDFIRCGSFFFLGPVSLCSGCTTALGLLCNGAAPCRTGDSTVGV